MELAGLITAACVGVHGRGVVDILFLPPPIDPWGAEDPHTGLFQVRPPGLSSSLPLHLLSWPHSMALGEP